MQPAKLKEEGSPAKKPCANIGLPGTANEQSASGTIKSTDAATAAPGATIHAGPVPLFLVPQTISTEIHAHGGAISGISVRRTGQHVYAITITTTAPKAGACVARKAGDVHAD